MRPQIKAVLWIGATFVVGTAFGMVLNGVLADRAAQVAASTIPRSGERPGPANRDDPRGPAGFVGEMERVIQPRDDAQREQLRPYFEATDRSNRAIVDGARFSMAAALDSLRAAIAPMLDETQRERLAKFGGPPNGADVPGMRGRGPGPDGRGPGMGRGPGGFPGGPPGGGPPRGGPPR